MKVTLITPPDIYQNNENSILFIGITAEEQEEITNWLASYESTQTVNLYYYQGEDNATWIFHSLACASYKYINADEMNTITMHLASYMLTKPNVYYRTDNDTLGNLYAHINANKVNSVTEFLNRCFCEK